MNRNLHLWLMKFHQENFKPFKQHADSQPIHFVDGDEPPLLFLHGRNDTTVKLHNINLTAKVTVKKVE